jgi:hypothetical protein
MPKEKKKADRKKKAGKKASQLAIRIEKSERDAFVELCDRLDTSAAREIRRFMREFVAAHPAAAPTAGDATQKTAPEAKVAPAPAKKPRNPRIAKEPAPQAEDQPPPAPARRRRAAAKAPVA